jgi:hypothetical protein
MKKFKNISKFALASKELNIPINEFFPLTSQ